MTVGNHRVHPGQYVFIKDPDVVQSLPAASRQEQTLQRHELDSASEMLVLITANGAKSGEDGDPIVIWQGVGATATFGRQLSERPSFGVSGSKPLEPMEEQLPLVAPIADPLGCSFRSYGASEEVGAGTPWIAFVQRGQCTFHQKFDIARDAGAFGIVVWGNDDDQILIRPSEDPDWWSDQEYDLRGQGDGDITMIYVPRSAGSAVSAATYRGETVQVSLHHLDAGIPTAVDVEDEVVAELDRLAAAIIDGSGAMTDDAYAALAQEAMRVLTEGRKNEDGTQERDAGEEDGDSLAARQPSERPETGSPFKTGRPAHRRGRGRGLARPRGPPPLMIAGLPIRNVMLERDESTDED